MSRLRLVFLALALPVVLLVACGGGSPAAPEAPAAAETVVPTTRPAPAAATPPGRAAPSNEPDGQRVLGYVKKLSDDIGIRPAGTPAEDAAVDFLVAELRSFGYEVTIQDFPISNEASRESAVRLLTPSAQTVASLPVGQSAASGARGRLVLAGIGRPEDFPAAVRGNIALIERGELTFQSKVTNAIAAGAAGVVIYNNEPGSFLGNLSQPSSIPVASISREEGRALAAGIGGGAAIEAEVSVGAVGGSTAHNVIAKPPGRECDTVTGGHFDSVPGAPGASDNASGTATALEVAGIIARTGQMGGHCFVLWGAEELGLVGSRAYVNSLSQAQRARIKAVINLDMVGVGDQTWSLIGNATLQGQAQAVALQLGIDARRGSLTNTSSDHASFISAGIPAVMIHRLEDPLLHTPQDVSTRVRPELLEEATRLTLGLLQALGTGG